MDYGKDCGKHFFYEWEKSQPMREDLTYATSSLFGWDLTQPYIYNMNNIYIIHNIKDKFSSNNVHPIVELNVLISKIMLSYT